jgi:probable DNA repair protein
MSLADLFINLLPNTLIITPNRRLALFVKNAYDRWQQNQNKEAWASIDVVTLNEFLKLLWNYYAKDEILLNDAQELLLWEQVGLELYGKDISSIAFAKEAKEAWRLLIEWVPDFDSLSLPWVKVFKNKCYEQNWITQSELAGLLVTQTKANLERLPVKNCLLLSFDHLPPNYQQLFSHLGSVGIKIEMADSVNICSEKMQIRFSELDEELIAMANWAKCNAQLGKEVACVIPNLVGLRSKIDAIFSKIVPGNFDISAGKALADYPVIYDALLFLTYHKEMMTTQQLSRFVKSTFLVGSREEANSRALLDLELFKQQQYNLPFRIICVLASDTTKKYYSPILVSSLQKLLQFKHDVLQQRSCEGWACYFSEILQILGWPGEDVSTNLQVIERWQKLLQEFSQLSMVANLITYDDALRYLNVLANACVFQEKPKNVPQIKILGALEAAGLEFDCMWIQGLSDNAWPPTPKPNALLPTSIQKKYNMPHASAPRELDFCSKLLYRIQNGAKKIIHSFALQGEDMQYGPSFLIKDFPIINQTELDVCKDYNRSSNADNSIFETITDNCGPGKYAAEKINGGTRIFKAQLHCPFRAFAEHRLKTFVIKEPYLGLDALSRGQLVHDILARVWQHIKTQQDLSQLGYEKLSEMVASNVEQVLHEFSNKFIKNKLLLINAQLLIIEKARLNKIINDWLQFEKTRPPFRVLAQEQWQDGVIGDLSIKLRLDRIDMLPDSSIIIIDYKTGKVSAMNIRDDIADDPQLPIYAILAEQKFGNKLAALLLAQVKANQFKFVGVSNGDLGIDGVKAVAEYWQELMEKWRSSLIQLSADFCQGRALINPKHGEQTCRECYLHSLCRKGGKT